MLELHSADGADALLHALVEVLSQPQTDPFAPEVVAVPTRGVERWITQQLSGSLGAREGHADGVCANIDFPPPGALIGEALAAASGIDAATDPWRPRRLVWPLLSVVEANLDAEWLAPLADHLRSRMERRFARVMRIAELYARYGDYRPAMIQEWAAGAGDHWQAELWRALRSAVDVPSPAERLPSVVARLREQPEVVELPERLSVFGLTRLPDAQLEVLKALAVGRDVHLMLHLASTGYFHEGLQNPLLTSWGRESRELSERVTTFDLGGHSSRTVYSNSPTPLLLKLQADIRANTRPPGAPLPGVADQRLVLLPDDRSVAIHACHGRARQVEVLREAILHRLAADPTLQPRDVIVMCPDVETFAPLIEATFADGELPIRLADRALRQTNPLLGVLARLLELPGGRVTASDVLDLLDSEPVRRRLRFDDDDLARIRDWVAEAAIHWGLDAASRVPFRLRQEIQTGTWATGLRRILLGVALGGSDLYEGVLPVSEVQSDEIELAGRFAELVDRLAFVLGRLTGPQPVGTWVATLAEAADALAAVDERDEWQRYELDRLLADVVGEAGFAATPAPGHSREESEMHPGGAFLTPRGRGPEAKLSLPEFRSLIGDRLAGRPTRANFRTGQITVCTLMPMRSVPHRLICLLGLDEGAFPRQARRDGDDLLLQDPRPGDRDPRAEDRQLLLDALMAAQDALVITYSGHDERTGAYRPPSVPVGELMDTIDATARLEETPELAARERIRVNHPLQPFDPRNFAGTPWSFDPVALAGAHAFVGEREPEPPFLAEPLPPFAEDGGLTLTDLVAFVQNPVRAFLRQRLELSLFQQDSGIDDALPVELDQLGKWGVGQRLLDGVLAGAPGADSRAAEEARGTLPPGRLGSAVLAEVAPAVNELSRVALRYIGTAQSRSFETNVTLPDGTRLTGTVAGVRGDTLLSVSYSRLNAQHRLSAWVRLLALTAAHPEIPFEALTVARNPNGWGGSVATVRIRTLGGTPAERRARALAQLDALVELRRRGMREPLPLPTRTAAAYAEARIRRSAPVQEALTAAEKPWRSEYDFRNRADINREDKADEHLLGFGGQLPLTELAAWPPAPDELGDEWPQDEPSRFGRYAVRLWQPLLASETWD